MFVPINFILAQLFILLFYFIFILYLDSYLFPFAWWQHHFDANGYTQTYRQTAFDRL